MDSIILNDLKAKYNSIVFVLESVLQRLGNQPFILTMDKSKFPEYVLEWQRGMLTDLNRLKDLIITQEKQSGPTESQVEDEAGEKAARSTDPKDFLVVEDPKKPTTFHLQVKRNGKPDHNLMGGAWAALHAGFRGNKYEGPKKAEALRKLKVLYKKEGMPVPSEN
jgi:hypothetical protein